MALDLHKTLKSCCLDGIHFTISHGKYCCHGIGSGLSYDTWSKAPLITLKFPPHRLYLITSSFCFIALSIFFKIKTSSGIKYSVTHWHPTNVKACIFSILNIDKLARTEQTTATLTDPQKRTCVPSLLISQG